MGFKKRKILKQTFGETSIFGFSGSFCPTSETDSWLETLPTLLSFTSFSEVSSMDMSLSRRIESSKSISNSSSKSKVLLGFTFPGECLEEVGVLWEVFSGFLPFSIQRKENSSKAEIKVVCVKN